MERDQRKHMGSVFFPFLFCAFDTFLCGKFESVKGNGFGPFPFICMCLFLFCLYVVYVGYYCDSFSIVNVSQT